MLERLGAEDEVELAVLERKRRVGLELDKPRFGQAAARALERDRGDVGAVSSAAELGGQPPVAAAEVERAAHAAERPHELAQVLRAAARGRSGTSSQSSSS